MIQRTLHQIWLGKKSPTNFLLACKQSVIDANKEWEYRYYTDTDILDHEDLKEYRQQLRAFEKVCRKCNGRHNPLSLVADLCRLAIIYVHGGIYLDHDMYGIRCLDTFLEDSLVIAKDRPRYVFEGVIGAPDHSKDILDVLKAFVVKQPDHQKNVCMDLTGWVKLRKWRVYEQEYFCPHSMWGRDQLYHSTTNTHTIHCWRWIRYDLSRLREIAAAASTVRMAN